MQPIFIPFDGFTVRSLLGRNSYMDTQLIADQLDDLGVLRMALADDFQLQSLDGVGHASEHKIRDRYRTQAHFEPRLRKETGLECFKRLVGDRNVSAWLMTRIELETPFEEPETITDLVFVLEILAKVYQPDELSMAHFAGRSLDDARELINEYLTHVDEDLARSYRKQYSVEHGLIQLGRYLRRWGVTVLPGVRKLTLV